MPFSDEWVYAAEWLSWIAEMSVGAWLEHSIRNSRIRDILFVAFMLHPTAHIHWHPQCYHTQDAIRLDLSPMLWNVRRSFCLLHALFYMSWPSFRQHPGFVFDLRSWKCLKLSSWSVCDQSLGRLKQADGESEELAPRLDNLFLSVCSRRSVSIQSLQNFANQHRLRHLQRVDHHVARHAVVIEVPIAHALDGSLQSCHVVNTQEATFNAAKHNGAEQLSGPLVAHRCVLSYSFMKNCQSSRNACSAEMINIKWQKYYYNNIVWKRNFWIMN